MIVPGTDLGSYVEAYEEAHARGEAARLEAFLPDPGHPLRLPVLLELVRIDLEHGWLAGRPTPLDGYRRRFPELFADPRAVREVLYEEYRLRTEVGLLAGSTAAVGAGPAAPPAVGSSFAGFRLLAELGKGAFGRVFLVEQEGLAARPAVLKIGTDLFHESQALAQLQHTHIVPIYSAHRQGNCQALCMPFLGVLTLADLIAAFAGTGPPGRGTGWLAVAEELRQQRGEQIAAGCYGPAAAVPESHPLREADHVNAALWVGECLADGLAHAHQRGVLHRDIKPANVLLTDDFTPMLLDFNLAQDAGPERGFGGTLMYMPPEQLAGFLGRPARLDPRSDVYSLGLVLYELLTGSPPWLHVGGPAGAAAQQLLRQRLAGPPCVAERCPAAGPGVRGILRRCLHPDPACRYPSAAALREDLARQRQHRPLLHVREPLSARAGKLVRRHPRLLPLAGAALLAVVALLLLVQLAARSRQVARHAAREALARLAEETSQAGRPRRARPPLSG